MQHEVFISYHRNSSAELVEHIVAALESHGIKCWYAPRDVDSSYAGDIVKAINTCKVFLLVMNEQSSHSAHVLNEIDCAFNRFHQHESIRLLPFRTDNREISDDVRYYLGRIHFLDGTEPPEEDRINALVSRISYWIQSSEWNNNAQPVVQVQSIHSTTLVHNTNFVGRASELNEIYHLLHSDNNKLFLCGTGGIGKSELARQYGLKFQNEYRTILWFTYNSTLEDMIITDQFLLIHGLENEKQDLTTPQARETYYYKKLNYLKEHCDKHTLLIIDNFDAEDERTQELLEGPYSVIFTTRISREKDGYPELSIHPMDNPEDLIALFQKFYKRPLQSGDDMILLQIFDKIARHTYGIELLARQMQASRMSPASMLDFFNGKETPASRRSHIVMEHILNVMTDLFHLGSLTEEKLSILKNMALLPVEGIETETFFDLTELDDFMLIDELIDSSFIQYNYITDVISLHPLIVNTIQKNDPDFVDDCQIYIQNLTRQLSSFTHLKSTEKRTLLSLAEAYYLKWCSPSRSFDIPFMEHLAEAYAEYFIRDKSIAIMKRLLTLNPKPLKASWYHYYISNQLRCLEQYDGLSSEAALSLSLLKDLPDSLEKKQQLSRSYSMMGWAKYHTDDFEQAFSYFEHSLHLRKETLSDDNVLIAWAYFNSASVLTKMKETEKAIQYYEEAIRRFLLINEIGICVPAYICIAEAYLDLNDCTKATNALEQAFTYEYEYYGEENCRKYWLYDIKSKILEKQGKNDEAAEYRRWSEEEYKKYIQSRET